MSTNRIDQSTEPRVFSTLKSDLKRGDFLSSISSEFGDTKEFLLDEQRKAQLEKMGTLKRWWLTAWWMLKAMFFKLTPARRILFVAGIILMMSSTTIGYSDTKVRFGTDTRLVGMFCIILVLMLELKDKLEAKEELEAGRIVQEALKPARSPYLPGWNMWLFTRSANEVGGDLVDFIQISDDRAGVVLGDVAGKGLRAALLMVKLQATLRALVGEYTSLSALAMKLNRIFCRDSLKNIFASMVYIELQPNSSRVRVVNAGHFPPLIVRGGKITKLEKGGAAFGIMPTATYVEEEVVLENGDVLCAYSDGISEAGNRNNDFFGEERIHEILLRSAGRPVESIGIELIERVDQFIFPAKTRDDLTVILLARSG